MSDEELEEQLGSLLLAQTKFTSAGYEVIYDKAGHVIITRAGHLRGIWLCERGELQWIPAGYNAPTIRVSSTEAAVDATLDFLKIA
ncbi:MAG: hypothetical protein NW216_01620 [Hyphomicrobium sp.]|nr:hypothetical protein [Hyphomicrobium sp.]